MVQAANGLFLGDFVDICHCTPWSKRYRRVSRMNKKKLQVSQGRGTVVVIRV